ncbi:M20/M25/M40 family metallo-hydrolase [Aquincola sp. S2]|uniref:M20/M25/M40 family metallo-hydrolase n=1 Tax=Pseudaquabacterium terrae TaxID=2732868 RepID=A0ABX2EAA1_9BURK|nr:glutamate carboxypeptidase [Aquabacterium terrae]NRF65990.1 M20/M25/M40 family metallo-hydrolase [Aquabacterium terrae]
MNKTALGFAVAALLALPATPALAARDAALLAAAEAAQPALIESLKDMVAIESGSQDAAGVARMADYAEQRLKALGAAVERVPPSNGKGAIVKATLTGTGKRRFLLISHMDTVYPAGTLAQQPWRIDGNKIYGPGIADDKGGVAVILHTLALLKQAAWRDYAQLTVLLNADEEIGSPGSGELLATLGEQHDVVLSFEPPAAKAVARAEGVLLSAAGTATAVLEVKGRASHAGAAPDIGRNALIELAHQILQTQDIAKNIPGAQLNWTWSHAGAIRNQIPESASATADVRLMQADSAAKLEAALKARIAESKRVPDTEVSVRLVIGRPPYVASERGRALALKAQAIYAELDGRTLALVPTTGGATDAGYAGRSGKPAVLESLGLAGWGYHARDEYIEIDSIVPRLYLASRLLIELGRE